MEFMSKTTTVQQYELSNIQENIEMVIYSLLCLSIPFAIGHPQFLVGTLVNAALILAALNLRDFKLLPVIMLPSIGVLMGGAIFGGFTMLLVYMIPFIWAANALYVFVFKYFNLAQHLNSWLVVVIGSVVKMIFLFAFAFLFVKLGVLPSLFLTSMGLFQLYTALVGGALALLVQSGKKLISRRTTA